MSMRTYFKPKDGLPNPKGPLSQSIPSQAIVLANIDNDRENCGPRIQQGLSNPSMISCFTFTVGLRLASTCTVAVQHARAHFKISCLKFFGHIGDV